MKTVFLLSLCISITVSSISQPHRTIQKSWIKTSTENLSGKYAEPDTLYTRYTFQKSGLYISFYPGWQEFKMEWSIDGSILKTGFDSYKIEELTDSSLTIALKGFRRFKFLSEEYLSNQDKYLDSIGSYDGKPLYKANNYISPRYSKNISLRDEIQKKLEGYNIKKAAYFLATFIVSEEGNVQNVQIIKGITEGFDNEVASQLLKTSKEWKPALFKGKPIQTQMFYDIKYLDSISPFDSGQLNGNH